MHPSIPDPEHPRDLHDERSPGIRGRGTRMAGTKIVADFSAPTQIDEQIVRVPFPQPPEHLHHIVYIRHEHNHYRKKAQFV